MKKILMCVFIVCFVFISGCSTDLCKQKVEAEGNCKAYFTGYEYDSELEKCTKVGVSGCDFKGPFTSLEDCQVRCE